MTNHYLIIITLIIFAYFLGAIPFGYLFTKKFTGQNILHLGSGNIGSTNVKRVAGKKIALITQICDILKGFIPVALALVLQNRVNAPLTTSQICIIALATIMGHNFSIFLKFKGGKGVNTTLGASVLLAPWSVAVAIPVYFIVKRITSYVSLGSISLALMLPISHLLIYSSSSILGYLIICAILIVLTHHSNIRKIIQGTEDKAV